MENCFSRFATFMMGCCLSQSDFGTFFLHKLPHLIPAHSHLFQLTAQPTLLVMQACIHCREYLCMNIRLRVKTKITLHCLQSKHVSIEGNGDFTINLFLCSWVGQYLQLGSSRVALEPFGAFIAQSFGANSSPAMHVVEGDLHCSQKALYRKYLVY